MQPQTRLETPEVADHLMSEEGGARGVRPRSGTSKITAGLDESVRLWEKAMNGLPTSLTAAVEFEPFALIKGRASIGYRNFDPLSPGLPDYKGLTANGDLSYTLLGATRFATAAIVFEYESRS